MTRDACFARTKAKGGNSVLSEDQISFYREHGYLALPGYLADIVADANAEIERLCKPASTMDTSDDLLDLEDSHTRDDPRVRRVKRPDLQSEFFRNLLLSDRILDIGRSLIGPDLRLHTTKLNMKRAQYGAPIQWHQDFAFYPHTNSDVLAIGIVFDDVGIENGPLQVIPGSHRGPILDHHADGYFAGSCTLDGSKYTSDDAVTLTGPAGTVTVHHAHTLHASALNTSNRDRRMLFYEMMAADAWPVQGAMTQFTTLEDYNTRMLCGEPTIEPRCEPVAMRLPIPQPPDTGSIYTIQKQRAQASLPN